MLFRHAIGRPIVIALLLVVGFVGFVGFAADVGLVPSGSSPLGPEIVFADSRCDDDYDHTHGWGWWRRTDAWQSHGYGINPNNGLFDHWTDHENSPKDWCDD